MRPPPSTKEKLRIIFRKALRKGFIDNAELDPERPPNFHLTAESNETLIVRVDSTKGGHYWFSDRRLLQEEAGTMIELFRYEAIQKAHWMFRDLVDRWRWVESPSEITEMKVDHFDRLELELPSRNVALEGLNQAYMPALNFFWWVIRSKGAAGAAPDPENGSISRRPQQPL